MLFSGISWTGFIIYLVIFVTGYYVGVFTTGANLVQVFSPRKNQNQEEAYESQTGEETDGELTTSRDYTISNSISK